MGNNKHLAFIGFLFILALFVSSCGHEQKGTSGKTPADSTAFSLDDLAKKIASDPSNPGLYNQRAKVYIRAHEFDKALTDINKAIQLAPKDPEFYITLSDIYLLTGRGDNCGDALNRALSLDPRNKAALVRIAKLNLVLKNYPATFDYVKKALDVDPVNPVAFFIRAIALLEKGDTVKAVDDLKTAVEQDQKYFEALVELGELYSIRKDNLAADYLKSALAVNPASKEALYMLGMFYQETDRYDNAIQTYQTLRKVDSTFKNAPYNIGYIYLVYLKNFREAAGYFSAALRCDPGYVDALYNRGLSYEYAGEYDKAYQDYQKVLKLKTNYGKAIEALNRLDRKKPFK
jgi:tetratricopeptide (TPR) repeat protein